ncbi:hypothetical protein BO71DRAFT_110801 [Aspergillus ellipticus CBS 707.79]|uniref:Uncharacterized protein n=1 Tax=Aspergillus ellipticus CBS 707.79 TaxID=1448320 RepID=A0A319D4B7_9EURO|nr:hypothetical protein BO71DRAFT_110801 [Aspergillus ellipticus CBS 707.79]
MVRKAKVNGGEYFLVVNDTGCSALDIAKDAKRTPGELQKIVQEEYIELTTAYKYHHVWSLTTAAKRGEMAAVQRPVEAGVEINVYDRIGHDPNSAIEEATKQGHVAVVAYLWEADKNRIRQSGHISEMLELAVQNGQHEKVTRLRRERAFVE